MLTNGLKLVEAMEKAGFDLTSRSPRIQTIEKTDGLWQFKQMSFGTYWINKGCNGCHVWTYRGDATFSYPLTTIKGPFLVPVETENEKQESDILRKSPSSQWNINPKEFRDCPDNIGGEWTLTTDKKDRSEFWRKWVGIPQALLRDLGPYLCPDGWVKDHLNQFKNLASWEEQPLWERPFLHQFVTSMLRCAGWDVSEYSFEEVWDFLTNPEGKTIRCIHDYETNGVICSHSAEEDFNQALVAFEKDHHRFPQMEEGEDPPVDTCALTGKKGHILRDKKGTSVVLPVVGRVTLFSNNPKIPCQQRYGKNGSGIVPVNEETVNKIGMALVKITEPQLYGETWCRLRLGDRSESGGRKDDLLIAFYQRMGRDHIIGPARAFTENPYVLRNERLVAQRRGRFISHAEEVMELFKARINSCENSGIEYFVIRRADAGRHQVIASGHAGCKRLRKAAKRWVLGAMDNVPDIPILRNMKHRVPFPMDLVKLTSGYWKRDGEFLEEPTGVSGSEALEFYLYGQSGERPDLTNRIIEMIDRKSANLLSRVGQNSHGNKGLTLTNEQVKAFAKTVGVIGILLRAKGIYYAEYMVSAPFLLGKIAHIADRYQFVYFDKYKDEIPNQLLGNSFSDILLESPFDAMAELSRRIEVYRDVVKRISSNHPYGKRIANLDKTWSGVAGPLQPLLKDRSQIQVSPEDRLMFWLGYNNAFKTLDVKESQRDFD